MITTTYLHPVPTYFGTRQNPVSTNTPELTLAHAKPAAEMAPIRALAAAAVTAVRARVRAAVAAVSVRAAGTVAAAEAVSTSLTAGWCVCGGVCASPV